MIHLLQNSFGPTFAQTYYRVSYGGIRPNTDVLKVTVGPQPNSDSESAPLGRCPVPSLILVSSALSAHAMGNLGAAAVVLPADLHQCLALMLASVIASMLGKSDWDART